MTALHDNPWDLFPEHHHVGTEESGNEIVLDMSSGKAGPVYGLWHDPPAVVVLARTERDLRALVPGLADHPADTAITLPESVLNRLDTALAWSRTHLLTLEAARSRLGPEAAQWLSTLPAESLICDLRDAEPGTGFEWGADSKLARHPDMAVFACVTLPKKPSFLKRLFG